ncbi:MAG: YceI family protein [Deltaproteobacteria bacterium]|nr:YceI family protein [Deltaproteobacteria bacterium]
MAKDQAAAGLARRTRFRVAVATAFAASALGYELPAGAGSGEYVVDAERSKLMVHVFRAGAFSPLLHDHHFAATNWNARTSFDPDRPGDTRATVTVQASSLRDQQPALSEKDLAKVNAQVQGPEVLDAARHPTVRFELERLELAPGALDAAKGVLRGKLVGTLTLHGQTRRISIPVAAKWSSDWLAVNGKVAFRQSDFGIKPYRKMGGAIAVQDAVEVELALNATREKK